MVSTLKQYNDLYKKAYEILGDLTPLESDCGELCSAACCKGNVTENKRKHKNKRNDFKQLLFHSYISLYFITDCVSFINGIGNYSAAVGIADVINLFDLIFE